MDGRLDGWMNGWGMQDGEMDEWMGNGGMDGRWVDGCWGWLENG